MQSKHLKRLGLVAGIQWILMATGFWMDTMPKLSNSKWLGVCWLGLLVVLPVAGFMWALYDAPLGARSSQIAKTAVITIIALGLSVVSGVAGLATLTLFGAPLRH